jgi:hypothetical protein
MLKLNESVDKNIIKSNLEKAEKEPGFTCNPPLQRASPKTHGIPTSIYGKEESVQS